MKKKYAICDLNKGILSEHVRVFAESPTSALKSAGYIHIERDYTGKRGNAIVYSCQGRRESYVYYATN